MIASKMKVTLLFAIILTSSLVVSMPRLAQPVKADKGSSKVYIICLSDVGGWWVDDPSVVKDGAIRALSPSEEYRIPPVHPKHGLSPPFYDISYQVITDWSTYETIIESFEEVIVLNTHGEILPIPSGYTETAWVDKIADAMLCRRVSWVHIAGYPFYRIWHQGATNSQEWPPNGSFGFKNLTSHVNMPNVECWPSGSENELVSLKQQGEDCLQKWDEIHNTAYVELGRPLKALDFNDYLVMPIHGGQAYYTSAIIAFAKPSQRFTASEQHGFGAYIHIGTNQTYKSDMQTETNKDKWRGYVATAAAVWAEMQSFHRRDMKAGSLDVYPNAEYGVFAKPVISSYHFDSENEAWIVRLSIFVYGCLKTEDGTYTLIDYVNVLIDNVPADCKVKMVTDLSRSGNDDSGLILSGIYQDNEPPIAGTLLYGLSVASLFVPELFLITIPLGGIKLYAEWLSFLQNPKHITSGVDEWATKVDFSYYPNRMETTLDSFLYEEFEDIITIEVRIPVNNRLQWNIVPLNWEISLFTFPASPKVAWVGGGLSIAVFNEFDRGEPYKPTIFFEDFEDSLDYWTVGDSDSFAGDDYWGIYTAETDLYRYCKRSAWCSQVGDNSIEGTSNVEVAKYDKGMDAYLELAQQLDLRPYQDAELSYKLRIFIKAGDCLEVKYYNGSWHELRNYTDPNEYFYTESSIPIPTTTTNMKFRFVSNNDDEISGGAFVDNIEIKATIPNDAGKGVDAGDDFGSSTVIEVSETTTNYAGYLIDDDWYQFSVVQHQRVAVQLRYPSATHFEVTLYDPQGNPRTIPSDSLNHRTHCGGNWSIKINKAYGFGQYDFDIRVYGPVYTLQVITRRTWGSQIVGIGVTIDGQGYESPVIIEVNDGTHIVTVDRVYYRPYSKYTFQYWEDESTNPTRTINVNDDTTITAYYNQESYGGCPTLYTWNGSEYVEEGLLNIHSPEGIDTFVFRILSNTPTATNGKYLFKLIEGTENESHSFIDMVKLFAMDTEFKWYVCSPIAANHSEYGDVLPELQASDDIRTDILPEQEIWLTFEALEVQEITLFIFVIEGYNPKPIPQ